MMKLFLIVLFLVAVSCADLWRMDKKGASLKPISVCCDIPELGDPKNLEKCSNPKPIGPCKDIQCAFDKSGFLKDPQTLDKEAYTSHLRKWAEGRQNWTEAIEKAISDCVYKDLRQYLDYPCRAYDVFTCTSIALMKKCPNEAWKCK